MYCFTPQFGHAFPCFANPTASTSFVLNLYWQFVQRTIWPSPSSLSTGGFRKKFHENKSNRHLTSWILPGRSTGLEMARTGRTRDWYSRVIDKIVTSGTCIVSHHNSGMSSLFHVLQHWQRALLLCWTYTDNSYSVPWYHLLFCYLLDNPGKGSVEWTGCKRIFKNS